MAYNTVQQIHNDINAKFANNTTRNITEPVARQVLNDLVDFYAQRVVLYDQLVHTTDADFTWLEPNYVVVCDVITADRILTLPVIPPPRPLILFVDETPGFRWRTNIDFVDGGAPRRNLSSGFQALLWDTEKSRWILIGGL
ncbi:hypothetical protein PV783_34235 [Chitinophaga sp. CC14]|uniref:hypothetical protein n=1 Tax=Chitinophaga sp. CC14 TaxID=3029199 RepID=UPI003B81296B